MRTAWARILTALGVLLITGGLLAGVANREVLDGDRFAEHVDQVRSDPAVARLVGVAISDRVIEQQPELVGLRPLLESASTSVVASDALGPVVRSTVAPLHRALVSGTSDQVLLRLADVGVVLIAALRVLDPDTTVSLPEDLDVTLADFGAQDLTRNLIDAAHLVSTLSWLLPLLGVVVLALAWWVAPVPRRGGRAWLSHVQGGLYWVAGAVVMVVFAGDVLADRMDRSGAREALLAATWFELHTALWRSAAVVTGVALAVAVVSLPDFRLTPRGVTRALTRWYRTRNPSIGTRMTRGAVLLGSGLALALEPQTVVRMVLACLGVVAVVAGVREMATAVAQWLAIRVPRTAARIQGWFTPSVALGLSLAVIAAVVVVGAWPQNTSMARVPLSGTACNGHDELCDRRYDDVSFVATHNSMSAADGNGWFLAEQPTGVIGQLDDGVRVFLIDSWPGQRTAQPSVIANSSASRAEGLAQAEAAFGKEAVDAALRLRGALNLEPTGPVRPYLCHALCELGSTEWTQLMQQVKAWMDQHPREVLTFYVEDYVTPAQTAQVFRDAGLVDHTYVHEPGTPWPTLGEMIEQDRRLVVFNQTYTDPAYPWLMHGEGLVQDTPFAYTAPRQFSCEHFRGPRDAPLFMVNHWLSNYTTRIADAQRVNARQVLLPRLEKCQEERGQVVNFVAVNYYDRGDAQAVVDQLNGVA